MSDHDATIEDMGRMVADGCALLLVALRFVDGAKMQIDFEAEGVPMRMLIERREEANG